MKNFNHMNAEHAVDIFRAAIDCSSKSINCALAFVIDTEGGAVRRPGACMLITESGESLGYVSGGCIDADVCAQAVTAIKTDTIKRVRYGLGSKYMDLKLPCGGAIDILICPNFDTSALVRIINQIDARRSSTLALLPSNTPATTNLFEPLSFTYYPKLHIRIAGRGYDPRALARLAISSGINVTLQSPDIEDFEGLGPNIKTVPLSPKIPEAADDEWTAFCLMFHDTESETVLLEQALIGPAFYIGAVGSRRTHQNRRSALENAGVSEGDIDRIFAPIGLVPSLRDASMLAISALAEIIGEYHRKIDRENTSTS